MVEATFKKTEAKDWLDKIDKVEDDHFKAKRDIDDKYQEDLLKLKFDLDTDLDNLQFKYEEDERDLHWEKVQARRTSTKGWMQKINSTII